MIMDTHIWIWIYLLYLNYPPMIYCGKIIYYFIDDALLYGEVIVACEQ